MIITSTFAKQGCCSHHGGVAYCGSNGFYICQDGEQSPSCTCGLVNSDIPQSNNNIICFYPFNYCTPLVLTPDECTNSVCCQIGNTWNVQSSIANCNLAQQLYYQRAKQNQQSIPTYSYVPTQNTTEDISSDSTWLGIFIIAIIFFTVWVTGGFKQKKKIPLQIIIVAL
ncbi:hypothetical protein GF362_00050 [Candidatus Dojkabacteria bacterium]|nr:hypothetical protein [Candidatus Dojkabacteria bacterium]